MRLPCASPLLEIGAGKARNMAVNDPAKARSLYEARLPIVNHAPRFSAAVIRHRRRLSRRPSAPCAVVQHISFAHAHPREQLAAGGDADVLRADALRLAAKLL